MSTCTSAAYDYEKMMKCKLTVCSTALQAVDGEHLIPLLLSDNTVQIFILQDNSTSSAETNGSSGNEFIDRPIPSKKRRMHDNEAFKIVAVEEDESYESPEEETEYFNGNKDIPILRRGRSDWGNQQLTDLLLTLF